MVVTTAPMYVVPHLIFLAALQRWLCLPNLTDEDTEALGGPGTFPVTQPVNDEMRLHQCLPGHH